MDAYAAVNGEPPPPPETGSLEGTVHDSDGYGISGATVAVEGTGRSATTDLSGNYSIEKIPAGTYDVTASAEGYQSGEDTATISTGQTTHLHFTLSLSPSQPEPCTMHIHGVEMAVVAQNPVWRNVDAKVTVLGTRNGTVEVVAGATVTGKWTGLVSGSASGTTGTNGTVTFRSDRTRGGGTVTFTVTGLTKDRCDWDGDTASGSISVP